MKFNLFKKKPKKEPIPVETLPERKLASKKACAFCTKPIYVDQGRTSNVSGTYHRVCWKQMRKEAGI